jgi:hypothetical protein
MSGILVLVDGICLAAVFASCTLRDLYSLSATCRAVRKDLAGHINGLRAVVGRVARTVRMEDK